MPTLNVETPTSLLQPIVAIRKQTRTGGYTKPLVWSALLLALSIVAIAVNGYHPYDEDAGIYVAGIKQAIRPGLYGTSADFVTPYFRWSLFPQWNAGLLRLSHVSLDTLLPILQILTTWSLIYALWCLAGRCFRHTEQRWAAVVLTALSLSVPVAGSSLYLMDPYLTGRSFSTPLALLAICACLDQKIMQTVILLAFVAVFHPLMAIYATGFVLILWSVNCRAWAGVAGLIAGTIAAGAAVQFTRRYVVESPAYVAAVLTRDYFFLYRWRWYELFGLAAPLVLLGAYSFWRSRTRSTPEPRRELESTGGDEGVQLAFTCIATGLTSVAVSLLFVHPQGHSHLLAGLQPMRAFVLIYLCLFLLLGGILGQFWLRHIPWRWSVTFAAIAVGVGLAQHQSYPNSVHLELPGYADRNPWSRAFLWIRANTPADAIFALDCDYIHAPGEDAHGFRAIAERASLADYSKDGGAAAVFPQLAERWMTEHLAQAGLNALSDAERMRRLLPLHVTWMVLDRNSTTAMPCPFEDETVKVCRLE